MTRRTRTWEEEEGPPNKGRLSLQDVSQPEADVVGLALQR